MIVDGREEQWFTWFNSSNQNISTLLSFLMRLLPRTGPWPVYTVTKHKISVEVLSLVLAEYILYLANSWSTSIWTQITTRVGIDVSLEILSKGETLATSGEKYMLGTYIHTPNLSIPTVDPCKLKGCGLRERRFVNFYWAAQRLYKI